MSTAYLAHPYQWPIIGWRSDIENWRQEDVEAFHHNWYAVNNALFVVCGAFDRATIIEDRAAAIAYAVHEAAVDDVILIAGKGHEDYQLIGGKSIDFSDYGVALASLEQRNGGQS